MITNGAITLYHYDASSCVYTPAVYENASIYRGERTAVRSGGFVNDVFLRIRLDTAEDIAVSTDDYVFVGITDEPIDKSRCVKVVGYGDNRRGALPHWRIECGQKYRR